MLDKTEGDECHLWLFLDQLRTPLMLPCLYDKVDKTEVKAGRDTDKAATVLRFDVLNLEDSQQIPQCNASFYTEV